MRKLFIILLFLLSTLSFATNYYVKNGGSDAADGLSDANAWETISQVNSSSFSAGDTIFFNKGDTWREILTIPSAGTVGNHIVFTSYGTGDNPKFLGSISAITWTNVSGNVWQSATTLDDPYAGDDGEVFFEETDNSISWGDHKVYVDLSELVNEYDWTWNANTLYVYAATDPDSRYNFIEAPQRSDIIDLDDQNYITIDGIDLFYSKARGVYVGSYPMLDNNGLLVQNCEIAYLGSRDSEVGYGVHGVYSDMIIKDNVIHDCGRRGVSLYLYASGYTAENILVEGNEFYNGAHTTSVDISIGSGAFTANMDSIVIKSNLIYDDISSSYISEGIFVQNYGTNGTTITKAYFYTNIIKYPSNSGIHLEGVNEAYIYNNTFYGHNDSQAGNTFHLNITSGTTVAIKNNIFYTLLNTDSGANGVLIYESSTQDHTDIDADYNLYYRIDNTLRIIIGNGTGYYMDDQATIISGLGWETNGVFSDPTFVSSSDYHLQAGSLAIGAGTNVGVTTDYDGETFSLSTPAIGAYEYIVGGVTAPAVTGSIASADWTRKGDAGGNVTSDGGGTVTARGVCWKTSTGPTISDSYTTDGTGTGSYTSILRPLVAGTTYYVRAYATNSTGTSYGDEYTFTTPEYSILMNGTEVQVSGGKVVIIK